MPTPVKNPQAPQKKRPAQARGQTRPQQHPQQRSQQHPPKQPQRPGQKPAPKKKRSLSAGEKRGAQMLLAILFVAAMTYLVLVLIIALLVWYSFGTLSENTTLYALNILDSDGETRIASYSVEEANNRYGLYIPYSDLAPLCGFGVAGDSEQITIYLPDAGGSTGSILCNRDSSLVEINGNSVRLSSPILFEGDDYLLPVSLFESYLSGLNIAYNDEKQLCTLTVPAKPAFSLKLHRPEPADPCTAEQLALAGMNAIGSESSEPDTSDVTDVPGEPEE